MKPDLPRVPLEAAAGPDNPPCPVCGEPLFPWVALAGGPGMSHRCEACGLGALSRTGTTGDALADFDRGLVDEQTIEFENRESLGAWLAGGAWSGLATDRAYRFTPEAVRRLVANRDQVVAGLKWVPGTSVAAMWQSGINMFTFGQNIATGALGGAFVIKAERPWQRWLDGFITIALAVPIGIISVPLELIGALFKRGGTYRAKTEVL